MEGCGILPCVVHECVRLEDLSWGPGGDPMLETWRFVLSLKVFKVKSSTAAFTKSPLRFLPHLLPGECLMCFSGLQKRISWAFLLPREGSSGPDLPCCGRNMTSTHGVAKIWFSSSESSSVFWIGDGKVCANPGEHFCRAQGAGAVGQAGWMDACCVVCRPTWILACSGYS